MNLTQEQLKGIKDCAYRLITPELVAINVGVDETDFMDELRTAGSPVRNSFYRGYVRQLIETREAIIKAAQNGSNPAQAELIGFMKELSQHLAHG